MISNDNSIILFHISGISYEVIVILKVIIFWLCLAIAFFICIIIPLAMILLNIEFVNVKIIFLSFLARHPYYHLHIINFGINEFIK